MKNKKVIKLPQFTYPTTTKFLLDNNLTDFDKILYIFISTLSAKHGYCFANNQYLSELCNCSIRNIQFSLARLKKYDHIYIEIKNNNQRIIRTYLSVCAEYEEKLKETIYEELDYDWLNEG